MRLHLVLPFIGYLFRKMFSGVFALHKKFRREMDRNTALSILLGFLCIILFTAITTVISSAFLPEPHQVRYVLMIDVIGGISYMVYTFFSIQFSNFLEERQELFDVIKDERGYRKPML